MKKPLRNATVYIENISPINFCGKPVLWQAEARIYQPPYGTEPSIGEHDFNQCKDCKEKLNIFEKGLTGRFLGKEASPAFPLCCEGHTNLAQLKEFTIDDFRKVPRWTAQKIIYTYQHIVNHIKKEDYFEEITDYIDYTIDSFGQTPNGAEPLYLNIYLSTIKDMLKSDGETSQEERKRSDRLSEYLESLSKPPKEAKTDFTVLAETYEKWVKIFPWEMPFFTGLKSHFERLPLLKGSLKINKYSGKAIARPHTKNSLLESLLQTTNNILTKINSLALYEKGLLTNPQQTKLDMIVNERRLKIKQGYVNSSPDEGQRYRKMLKAWFADEKIFIDDLLSVLKTHPVSISKEGGDALSGRKIDEFLNYFAGNCNSDFRNRLVQDIDAFLLQKPNGKQITALTHVIYASDKLHRQYKPKTFNKWLEVFCSCWNLKKPHSKPNAVKTEIEDMKSNFYYVLKDFSISK